MRRHEISESELLIVYYCVEDYRSRHCSEDEKFKGCGHSRPAIGELTVLRNLQPSATMLLKPGSSSIRLQSCLARGKLGERGRPSSSSATKRRLCRRKWCRISATSRETPLQEEELQSLAPRCYLIPSDDGDSVEEICITEGTVEIGVAESDYYFRANTGMMAPNDVNAIEGGLYYPLLDWTGVPLQYHEGR